MAEGHPGRSPVYDVPNIGRRVMAVGAFLRNEKDEVAYSALAAGLETCKDIERGILEEARQLGIPQTNRNITIVEEAV